MTMTIYPYHALSRRARMLRFVFRRCMKDKTLKALVKRFWPPMRVRIDGLEFELHPADNTTEFRLYTTNAFEESASLAVLLERVCERRVRVFDIGANCGLYTLPLARAADQGSVVHAFEPSPVMGERLTRNVSLNELQSRVRIHPVALGADAGTATLNVHPKNHGQSSLRELDASAGSVIVERRPLLDYLTGEPLPGIIKIDVEGREDDVLCPFLDTCPDELLPEAMLIEMVLESSWRRDLRSALLDKGYAITFEAEGNALFERMGTPA